MGGYYSTRASSWSVKLVTGFGFLLLYFPLVTLVVYSFLSSASPLDPDRTWTLQWYQKLFSNYIILDALKMSLVVGFWSTVGATLLGTLTALALTRSEFPGKKVLELFTYVPLVMPEMILGLSLLIWFVMLHLTLGMVSIILAHITFSLSYVIITVRARLQGFDETLEEAARDLGASPWETFWRVTFPLIWPGIFSGALMAFTLSFDDFLITFFTAGINSDTLPLKIYAMIKFGVTPEINALSTIILAVTLFLVLIFFQPFQSDVMKKKSNKIFK